MKVVSADEMIRIENLVYHQLGDDYQSHFMERAGLAVAEHVQRIAHSLGCRKICLLCAKGNNSGDAYVCGRILLGRNFVVEAWQICPIAEASPLCQKNYQDFLAHGGTLVSAPPFAEPALLVDGLLGTGFRSPLKPAYGSAIAQANASGLPIVAIDLPSGLDGNEGVPAEEGAVVIKAQHTVFLGLPKKGCFFGQAWDYVGELLAGDFGLPAEFIAQAQEDFHFVLPSEVRSSLPPIRPSRHKYQAGTVFALAGSKGMSGGALLCAFAALRSGCGMAFLGIPEALLPELAPYPLELIKVTYAPSAYHEGREGEKEREKLIGRCELANACVIGPGLSSSKEVGLLLEKIVPSITVPTVLDADALNLYSQKSFALPKEVVMTPHHGEFQRLLGQKSHLVLSPDLFRLAQTFVEEKHLTLILKGAVTVIFHPGKTAAVCTGGNAGMATAGSGDVLAGIVAALLAQGLSPYPAALLGVVLHGLSGKYARLEKTVYSMIASDLIEALPQAFKELITASSLGGPLGEIP